jgi:hypothetical protein
MMIDTRGCLLAIAGAVVALFALYAMGEQILEWVS